MLVSLGMGIAFGVYVVGLIKLATHPTVGHVANEYYEYKYNRLKNSLPLI
jgi:hypothetical protein